MDSIPETAPREQLTLFPSFVEVARGKDEMNFAEFPIAALCKRPPDNSKTVIFEDQIYDKKAGKLVTRRLMITGSDAYGLPVPFDDEVIFALVNIATRYGSKNVSEELEFLPNQIIEVLGLKKHTYYRERIEESLKRWTGVTMHYENAWREFESREWISEGFHLIESYSCRDEGYTIRWGKEVFRNLQGGNLRPIDLNIYRKLKGNVTKRMYRFLDKRFKMSRLQTFDLHSFAHNKIGLSEDAYTDVAQVKRALEQSINQLVEEKFITFRTKKERFTKVSAGVWQVHFEKYSESDQQTLELDVESETEAEGRLVAIGYDRALAKKDVSRFGEEYVMERLLWSEYRMDKGEIQREYLPRYVNTQIRNKEFKAPVGYQTPDEIEAERLRKAKIEEAKGIARKKKKAAEKAQEKREGAILDKAREFFAAQPLEMQESIEKQALASGIFKTPRAKEAAILNKAREVMESADKDSQSTNLVNS